MHRGLRVLDAGLRARDPDVGEPRFCRTGDDASCNDNEYGAFKNDGSSFFGTREALESLAPTVTTARRTPSSSLDPNFHDRGTKNLSF